MKHSFRLFAVFSAIVLPALCSAEIRQFNPAITGGWSVDAWGRVTIDRGNAEPYRFESYDGDTPSEIYSIKVDPKLVYTLPVKVEIKGDPSRGHTVGATDVSYIDLFANGQGVLYTTNITGSIQTLNANGLNADLTILPGESLNGFTVDWVGSMTEIDIQGDLNCNLNVHNEMAGQISIAGDLDHAVTLGGVGEDGEVNIDGAVTGGPFTVEGDMDGDLYINGALSGGGLSVRGEMAGRAFIYGDVSQSIEIHTLAFPGEVHVYGDILDTGDNHIWFHDFNNGEFECGDMGLMPNSNPWGQFCIGFYGTASNDEIRYTTEKTGTVTINGVLSGRIRAYGPSSIHFVFNSINAPLDSMDNQYGGLDFAGYATANSVIEVLGDMTQGRIAYGVATPSGYRGAFGGTISIAGNVGQNCIIGTQHLSYGAYEVDPCDVTADITIGGHCAGDILSTRHFTSAASITINGDVASTARIETIGAYQSTVGSIDSPIHVDGDCDGEITALDDLGADIRIDGQFQQNAAIDIDGAKDAGVIVLINDDGGAYLADRLWHDDATVSIGATTYENDSASVNTTTSDVWYIDAIKGDMDHDFALTGFDIDPFVLALTNETSYEATYPYLASSRVFRGDCNCDDLLNSFDIDPFVAWLVNGDPTTDKCPPPQLQMIMLSASLASEEENAGHANDPQTLAGILYASVTPTNLTAFEASLTADIAGLPAGAERTYWEAVLAELALLTE